MALVQELAGDALCVCVFIMELLGLIVSESHLCAVKRQNRLTFYCFLLLLFLENIGISTSYFLNKIHTFSILNLAFFNFG